MLRQASSGLFADFDCLTQCHIDVQVIAVLSVGFRAKCSTEDLAGRIVGLVQEAGFRLGRDGHWRGLKRHQLRKWRWRKLGSAKFVGFADRESGGVFVLRLSSRQGDGQSGQAINNRGPGDARGRLTRRRCRGAGWRLRCWAGFIFGGELIDLCGSFGSGLQGRDFLFCGFGGGDASQNFALRGAPVFKDICCLRRRSDEAANVEGVGEAVLAELSVSAAVGVAAGV